MKQFDVIVVGAGPAGLMAARTLQKAKKNYLLIDAKKTIGYPLKCAEGISEESFKEFFGHKKYPFVKNTVDHHTIIYHDLKRILNVNFLELDRPKWEKWMSKGLHILLDCRFENFSITKEYAEVKTSKGMFLAKIVILCTGCNFHIQKRLGMIKNNPTIAIAYGGIYKNYGLSRNAFYYYFDEEFYGYLWIFPKSKTAANIGIAFYPLDKKLDPKVMIQKFLDKYHFKAKQIKEYAGVIPCSGPINNTYHERLLVCGDAAGMVYAGTGEGIKYALKSGQFAAETAIHALQENRYDERFLKRYENLWKKDFGHEMKAGLLFFDLTIAAARLGKIKRLFGLPSEKEVKDLVLFGKYPFKAWLAWKICKVMGWTKLRR